jgi:hypothetical protein
LLQLNKRRRCANVLPLLKRRLTRYCRAEEAVDESLQVSSLRPKFITTYYCNSVLEL